MTTTRRLALVLFVFLVWTPAAYAWSWPVQGPVLQPFAYDEAHPYAAGQHRGIDLGADSAGETVVAPAAGTVIFAGSVPTNGKSVTIETADGYSVTLTHLGSIAVVKGATIAEQDVVGTVGPSGTPEVDGPYVHLGIRLTADPDGYVDPLGLLPAPAESGADQSDSTPSQPATGAASAPPATKLASSAPRKPRAASTRAPNARPSPSHVRTHEHRPAQQPRADVRTTRSHRPVVRAKEEADRASERMRFAWRPVVEPPVGLDVGHEPRPSHVPTSRRESSTPLLAVLCNCAAALFALGAVLLARRRRSNTVSAEVLHLRLPDDELRQVSRAA